MRILPPGLLNPKKTDEQVEAADERVVALHARDNGAIREVTVLHLAFGVLSLRLGHRLQGLPVVLGREGYEGRISVVPGGLNGLIVLNDNAIDVIFDSLAQEVIRIDVIERRNNNLKKSRKSSVRNENVNNRDLR